MLAILSKGNVILNSYWRFFVNAIMHQEAVLELVHIIKFKKSKPFHSRFCMRGYVRFGNGSYSPFLNIDDTFFVLRITPSPDRQCILDIRLDE